MPPGAPAPDAQAAITACFRPEDVRIAQGRADSGEVFAATIASIEFLGPFWRATLAVPKLGTDALTVDFSSNDTRDMALREGGAIDISLRAGALRVFRVDPQAPAVALQAAAG